MIGLRIYVRSTELKMHEDKVDGDMCVVASADEGVCLVGCRYKDETCLKLHNFRQNVYDKAMLF